MTRVLDAGALTALDRNDRAMWVRVRARLVACEVPVTHGGVVGPVWRGGPRQARLATALVLLGADGDEIVTLDREDFAILVAAADRHVELVRP